MFMPEKIDRISAISLEGIEKIKSEKNYQKHGLNNHASLQTGYNAFKRVQISHFAHKMLHKCLAK